jgi:hypothetical protein
MHIAMLLILPASAAVQVPTATAAGPVASVTTYNAFVATEETPAVKELLQPAVLIQPKVKQRISGWIA